ncbi:unnamed protein product, partial [Allacma fusca]
LEVTNVENGPKNVNKLPGLDVPTRKVLARTFQELREHKSLEHCKSHLVSSKGQKAFKDNASNRTNHW